MRFSVFPAVTRWYPLISRPTGKLSGLACAKNNALDIQRISSITVYSRLQRGEEMEDSHIVRPSSLIERLERASNAMDKENPFYWYCRLESLGKRLQTQEIVEEAVNAFVVSNSAYPILKVVAKKYRTRELSEVAVRRNGLNLKYVPEQYRDAALCMIAVESDGEAIVEVPQKILLGDCGRKICLTAVLNDYRGHVLSFVPDCYLKGREGRALCEAAVRANGYALEHVPKHLISTELAKLAIEASFPVRETLWPDGSHSKRSFYSSSCPVLLFVPKNCMSSELISLSVRLYPESLRCVPDELLSRDLCFEIIKRDPMNLRFVPKPDNEMIKYALNSNPRSILAVPSSLLTIKLCRAAMRMDPTIPIEEFPDKIRDKLEKEFRFEAFIRYEPVALETPSISDADKQTVVRLSEPRFYELASMDNSAQVIYYISDIHLEHQLVEDPPDIMKLSLSEVRCHIDGKIAELLSSAPENAQGILLIGGDIADSVELEKIFYEQLTSFSMHHSRWKGDIIAVLGNHELWDKDPMGLRPVRTIDEIVLDYRRRAIPHAVTLLENELLINYKGLKKEILDERTILDSSVEELAEACSKSTFILLGGIGFSGLNPVFNAEMGLYQCTVSMEEDVARSKRFRAVYEKVLTCAKDLPVIVLTHTQMADWSNAQYNPKWIYVSGHTHQNKFLLRKDGTSVFSDNQIGYEHKRWYLNSFTVDMHRYDPFEDYPDGVHRITREQYVEFNRCQGIMMQGMKHSGDLYVLKCDGAYMFVLESSNSLCLLEGGRLHKLEHDIKYYHNNLSEYIQKVRNAFEPYEMALKMISDEVKLIGGSGAVHGCIVDFDWYNHLYLNPFDGKVTPYFAVNTTDKLMFSNVRSLLESSPYLPLLRDGDFVLSRFINLAEEEKLPVLSRDAGKNWELATVPQVVLDRSMYEPSRIMRSIQYIFEQNVLRIWNDEVLTFDRSAKDQALPGMNKLLSS